MSAGQSLPALLEQQAARRPRDAAMRHKRLGIWRVVSWADYARAVREVALALDDLGLGAGDRVAVVADNGPAWLEADLGIQSVGAWSVGLYPALTPPELAAAAAPAGLRLAFCGDQEQVDKLLTLRAELPTLERIVVFDMKGLHTPEYAEAPLLAYDELRARGREVAEQRPRRYEELLDARSPDEVALVAFTSGTTGAARGALLRHSGELALARIVAEGLKVRPSDRAFSLLPLAHATARLYDAYVPLVAGSSVNFAEASDTVPVDIVELSPTLVVATPRLLERIRGEVDLRIARAGRVKRWACRLGARLMAGGGVGRAVGRVLVGRFVVAKAGLSSLRYGGIAGSFVAPELLTWFWQLGVPMREQYGQVETGGVVSTQADGGDLGTAGRPLSDEIEVRTDESGGLLVRSPGALAGYLDDGGDVLQDGWYATGDVVRIDDRGRIVPVARQNQLVTTRTGAQVSPAEIESALKVSPYVASAVVVAADRPFLAALLELNQEAVADWARHQGVVVTSYAALAGHERVVELIGGEVDTANARLPEGERVQAFAILPRPLDDELTPTGKIKRRVVEERFAGLVDELYGRERAPVA